MFYTCTCVFSGVCMEFLKHLIHALVIIILFFLPCIYRLILNGSIVWQTLEAVCLK